MIDLFLLMRAILLLWTILSRCSNALKIPVNTNSHHETTMNPWSQAANIDNNGFVVCQDCHEMIMSDETRDYDLSSPREWMEFLEATQGQGGAYTVLRCDYIINGEWRIWGRDFHTKRLCQSYCALMESNHVKKKHLAHATDTTNVILDSLLQQASLILNKSVDTDAVYTVMLTLLWQNTTNDTPILVRGHACCSGKPTFCHSLPSAVTATVALSFDDTQEFPNRFSNFPEAKLSTWCRQRRSLEQEFKVNGAAEVLLTQAEHVDNNVQILEGLTSNVFFLYPDNKVRTASSGVLKGFARQLVLDCLRGVGLEYDPTPIRIQDASLWKEVFLTSSIRLLIPVKQILIPDKEGKFHNLWLTERDEYPKCKQLYEHLLLKGGHDM